MKKLTFIVLFALLIANVALLSAQEPAPTLSGEISPAASWILHVNEVWELPNDATDLTISPVAKAARVEIETEEFDVTGDTAIPENNPDIRYRRIKPLDGDIYLWSTVGEHSITGWAPVGGIAVVKTGLVGAAGPPPPGNVTPEVTPEPEATPVPTVEPEPSPALELVMPSFSISEAGFLLVTIGEEAVEIGRVTGPPGAPGVAPSMTDILNALKADEAFLDSITPGVVVDHEALVANLKADEAFVASVRPEAATADPNAVAAILKGDEAFIAATRGEHGPEGPPEPTRLTQREGLILLIVLAFVVVLVGFVGWLHTQEVVDQIRVEIRHHIGAIETEIAPLRPRPVTFDTAGKPRCPGCSAFAKRIPPEIAGRCIKCGVAYVIPASAEEPIAEEVVEEAAAETS